MDYSTTNVFSDFVNDTSGHESSDDLAPLSEILKKPQSDDKQLRESTQSSTPSSNSNSGKYKSGLDDTSDDEPLIKMKTTSLPAKKPESKENSSGSSHDRSGLDSSDDDVPLVTLLKKLKDDKPQPEKTESPTLSSKPALTKDDGSDDSSCDKPLTKMRNASPANETETTKIRKTSRNGSRRNKKTEVSDLGQDDSSDDEPLIKMVKVSSKAAKEAVSPPTERSDGTDRRVDDDASSDDEPLSKLAKKLKSQRAKASVVASRKETPVKKSQRKAARKKVQYVESSSASSDDEPLIKMKKRTKGLSKEKDSRNSRKTKPKDKSRKVDFSSSDGSSDDDVPLANLIGKKGKPTRKRTEKAKKKPVSPTNMAKKRRVLSDESSDDEPLISLVKKASRGSTKTSPATTPKKRVTTPKKKTPASTSKTTASAKKQPRKTKGTRSPTKGSSSDSSDDEPLIKSAKTPQMDKILRIILERCDIEETRPTGCLNETSAEIPTDEEVKMSDSELPKESSEEA